jgi:hypothetical protein
MPEQDAPNPLPSAENDAPRERKHHPDCPALFFTDKPERCRCMFLAVLDRPRPIPPGAGAPPCEVHVPGRDEPSLWCAACRTTGASVLPSADRDTFLSALLDDQRKTWGERHGILPTDGCPTPGCPGDVRYSAPGRRHIKGCTHPIPTAEGDAHTPGCRDWMNAAPGQHGCVCDVAKSTPDDY